MTEKSALKNGGEHYLCLNFPQRDIDTRRNFLLFLPSGQPSLRAVISYYSATANVNQEGDVHINDTLQGFGMFAIGPYAMGSPCRELHVIRL